VVNIVAPVLLAWVITQALHIYLHPSDVRDSRASHNAYGPVRLRLKLPGTHAGIPEPLISCGSIGNASLVFIRLLPKSRAKVGVEFWNLELDQGPEFPLPAADGEIEVACYLPAFYPKEGDDEWGAISPEIQRRRRHEYLITVNGSVRLKGSVNYDEPEHAPIYLGVNPLGGSFVSNRFTGQILRHTQHF
jgi:hypothetical protein